MLQLKNPIGFNQSNESDDFLSPRVIQTSTQIDQINPTRLSVIKSDRFRASIMKANIKMEQCPMDEGKEVEIIQNINITVILNLDTKMLVGLPISYTPKDLKTLLSNYFNEPDDYFLLLFDRELNITDENIQFSSMKLKNPKYLTVYVLHNTQELLNSKMVEQVKNDKSLPDKNSGFVHSKSLETGEITTIRIDIETVKYTKHFTGGYRNKTTGIEYHHASTQTRAPPKKETKSQMEMVSRDTQTHKIRNVSINDMVTTWTQMTKPGYYVSNVEDRTVETNGYQTADELEAFILSKVIIIQKYYRRWLAKRRVAKLRAIKDVIWNYKIAEQNRKTQDKEKRLKELNDKLLSPLYNDDFDLLYHALEKWRIKQLDSIDKSLPISVQKALACQVMDEQHEWIKAIDRLKNNAVKILNFRAKKNKLIKVSKPRIWKNKFGEEIQLDFVETTRGREVFEVYKSLSMDFFNGEERLDILLTLKRMIKGRTEKAAQELVGLINRETDLIMRNVEMPLLKGLRTRICTLFLSLCRKPSFNPGVEKYLTAPKDPLDLRGTFQLCRICNNYLKNSQFMFSAKSKRLGACRTCTRLYNHSMTRQELSPYRNILNVLRKSEEEYQDYSKMAFIFSEVDMKHLICKIWDSKSILSSNDDLENLIFIRWINNHEWSPWNTVLMTYFEADAHRQLEDPCTSYDTALINKIHQKQVLGHNYFHALNELANNFTVHNKLDELKKIKNAKEEDQDMFINEKKTRFLAKQL